MSRSRWVVLLGPPLIVAAAGVVVASGHTDRVHAGALPVPRPAVACRSAAGAGSGAPEGAGVGTWWRSSPLMDAGGRLTGWRLTAGGGSAPGTFRLDVPAASSASGPDRGRVVVARDDGERSSIAILDVGRGCTRSIDLGTVVARRAIADSAGEGILVHLLHRATRSDLGVWLVGPDGRRTLVLGPVGGRTLAAAGIRRVWATNLATSRDGARLAVQSCDPDACVTRVLERANGRVTTLLGDQGDLVGFAGGSLITMAACHGTPCGVLAWSASGTVTALAGSTLGAAVAANGMVVIAIPGTSRTRAVGVDPADRSRHDLGEWPGATAPLPETSRFAGIEAGPGAVAVIDGSGLPSLLEVQP